MRIALPLTLLALLLISVYLFVVHPWWFPAGVSAHAPAMDHQFAVAFGLLGGLFILGQLLLAFVVFSARAHSGSGADTAIALRFPRGDWRFEAVWTIAITAIFFSLSLAGEKLWSQIKLHEAEPGALSVEVTGMQFQWYFRYAGADGKLGRIDAQRFARPEEGNPLGIDPDDPSGRDDIVSSTMVVPAGREVMLTLRAQDVIHSLFIPAMRFKQDAVPGMEIHAKFKPMQTGTYEIACTQLCGLGHYRMRAAVRVVSEAEFAAWLINQHF
jgi:cytochrome c oxidase subunit 2